MTKIMYTLFISALLVQAFALPTEKDKKNAPADSVKKNPVEDKAKKMDDPVKGAEHEMEGLMEIPYGFVAGMKKGMEQTMGGMGQTAGGMFSLFG